MRLLMLATQSDEEKKQVIVWGYDVDIKMIIKIHVNEDALLEISVGDIVNIEKYTKCRRQEFWINEICGVEKGDGSYLIDCLEKKAATPYSISQPLYMGNVVKIEKVLSVENNIIKAELYGFPKEIYYLRNKDYKWKCYLENASFTQKEWKRMEDTLNKSNYKFGIVDFPDVNQHGEIQIAALVVC